MNPPSHFSASMTYSLKGIDMSSKFCLELISRFMKIDWESMLDAFKVKCKLAAAKEIQKSS